MAKRAIALVIGNSKYPGHELKNPINDAKDFSAKLRTLGFAVRTLTDARWQDMDLAVDHFGDEVKKFDVGLFFFAGHGLQINGVNYLTGTDTNFYSEKSVIFSSVTLNKILSLMEGSKNTTNILILDACRDNPYERAWSRSLELRGLAPMYAPKGTIIAFATSPGQTALDGTGNNGLYTSALLAHIEDENIAIEELFKRVRNTVSAFSSGKQTSWEHTSLTGTFQFNSGQIVSATAAPYSAKAVADNQYKHESTTLGERLIEDLKNYNWDTQNSAISKITGLDASKESPDTLFVLGRNILQTAFGGSFRAQDYLQQLSKNIKQFNDKNENHVLNGILFEIYFNKEGKFRYDKLKACFIDEIFSIQTDPDLKASISFIQEQLKPFNEFLFVVPNTSPITVSFNIISEKTVENEYKVRSIIWEGNEILHRDDKDSFFSTGDYFVPMNYASLKAKISNTLAIPLRQITFNSNHSLTDELPIYFPLGHNLRKN